jgi:hypothetical protein
MSIMCKKCRQSFRPDKIQRIELRAAAMPEPLCLRLSDTPGDPEAGMALDGSQGCPRCLDAMTILGWLMGHLVQAAPVAWETVHVIWKHKGELAGVPRSALLEVPPPTKPRTVGLVGDDLTLLAVGQEIAGQATDYILLAGDPTVQPAPKSNLILPRGAKTEPDRKPQHQVWALRFEIPGVREGLTDRSLIVTLLDRLGKTETPNLPALDHLGLALAALNGDVE